VRQYLISSIDAAKLLGVTNQYMYMMRKRGVGPIHIKRQGKIQYELRDVLHHKYGGGHKRGRRGKGSKNNTFLRRSKEYIMPVGEAVNLAAAAISE